MNPPKNTFIFRFLPKPKVSLAHKNNEDKGKVLIRTHSINRVRFNMARRMCSTVLDFTAMVCLGSHRGTGTNHHVILNDLNTIHCHLPRLHCR